MLRIGSRAALLAILADKFSLSFASNVMQFSLARRASDPDSGSVLAKLGWGRMSGYGPGSRQPTAAGCQGKRVDRSGGLRAKRRSVKAKRAASRARLSACRTRQSLDAHDLRCGSVLSRRCRRAPSGSGAQSACFGGKPSIAGGRRGPGCADRAIISAEATVCDRGRAPSIGIRRSMNRGEQVTQEDVHVKFFAVELWRGRRLGG